MCSKEKMPALESNRIYFFFFCISYSIGLYFWESDRDKDTSPQYCKGRLVVCRMHGRHWKDCRADVDFPSRLPDVLVSPLPKKLTRIQPFLAPSWGNQVQNAEWHSEVS